MVGMSLLECASVIKLITNPANNGTTINYNVLRHICYVSRFFKSGEGSSSENEMQEQEAVLYYTIIYEKPKKEGGWNKG